MVKKRKQGGGGGGGDWSGGYSQNEWKGWAASVLTQAVSGQNGNAMKNLLSSAVTSWAGDESSAKKQKTQPKGGAKGSNAGSWAQKAVANYQAKQGYEGGLEDSFEAAFAAGLAQMQGGGGGWNSSSSSSSKARGKGPEQLESVKAAIIKDKDILAAIAELALPATKGKTKAVAQYLAPLLELSAKQSGPSEYGHVMAFCVEHDLQIDCTRLIGILVILTSRVPVPTGMVRLTLNLCVPKDGPTIPLIPKNATPQEEKALFEDGEPMEVRDRREAAQHMPSSWYMPSKQLGPQAWRQSQEEESDARATLTQISPEQLKGRLKLAPNLHQYFGHFCPLLHLETLVELATIKHRISKDVAELEKFGWAVTGLECTQAEVRPKSKKKDGACLPGRDVGTKACRLVFRISRNTDVKNLRIRSGDSVILSRSDPMRDCFCEAMVADAPVEDDGDDEARVRGGGVNPLWSCSLTANGMRKRGRTARGASIKERIGQRTSVSCCRYLTCVLLSATVALRFGTF